MASFWQTECLQVCVLFALLKPGYRRLEQEAELSILSARKLLDNRKLIIHAAAKAPTRM
jgi:hypothetical protein